MHILRVKFSLILLFNSEAFFILIFIEGPQMTITFGLAAEI